jgi:uncharacterized protein YndB with AHSA1/START domain
MFLAVLVFAVAANAADAPTPPARTIELEVVVDCAPADVYALWSTEAGIRKFFAPASHVDARPGGAYTIVFDPAHDPEGARAGTRGAKVLRADAPHAFDFEWDVGVPGLSESLKSPDHEPTWVELRFEPLPDHRTRVRFAHRGFRSGGEWDAAFAFFRERAWPRVLQSLQQFCRDGRAADWSEADPK